MDTGELSAQKRSIVICLRLPPRRSTRLTPPTPTPVLTADEAHDLILQDTIQLKGTKNVEGDSLIPRNDDDQNILGTRLEPRSDKESPEVEITVVVQPVNVNEKEGESADDEYELKRREKGKHVEETRNILSPSPIRSPRIHSTLISSDTEKVQELTVNDPTPSSSTPSSCSPNPKISTTNRLLSLLKAKPRRFKCYKSFFHELSGHVMSEALPKMVDDHIQEQAKRQVSEQVNASDDPHDDAHPEGGKIAKRQKTSEYEAYVSVESSSRQINKSDQGPSSSCNQEKVDDFDFWTNSYASDDDEVPTKQVSQDLIDEIMQTIDEAKLRKVADEMLRQQWIIGRRANGNIMSITKSDYKNLNKNDIEDMYLLVVNDKVPDYAETELLWSLSVFIRSTVIRERVHDFQLGMESYQHKVKLIAPTITFLGIKKYEMFSIVSEPVYGIIYKNNKKEKRVMRHSEIHKFCDATFKRVLVGLKSYNNDVKYGYAKIKVTKEDAEYLQLFEEEIEERLKHRDRMRRWEMYVNGRPLGSRRERPE
ncbi:hypothetical protein Tco_0573264 [Tanacetum coccineum]